MTEIQQKVLVYGLAYLHTENCKQALRNGMEANLPPSDVLTPNDITLAVDQLTEEHSDLFHRWGLGHLISSTPD